MNNFAKRLKEALQESRLSQKELAKAVGMTKSSISQYLSGRTIPRPIVQEKIAVALGCTVEWLNSETEFGSTAGTGIFNISVAQTAKLLGKGEQFVRVALQKGNVPFGFAVKAKNRWSYHISYKQLVEYLGLETNSNETVASELNRILDSNIEYYQKLPTPTEYYKAESYSLGYR